MILRVLLVISMLLSAASLGYLALQVFAPAPPPVQQVEFTPAAPAPPARVRILVAARPLPAGTLLKDEDFAIREVATEMRPDGAFDTSLEARGELRGALLRRYLDPTEPVLRGDVLRPRDRGFLAAVLRPGMRAVSIGVDHVTGTAGLIWPGDQVDLILSQELGDAPVSRRVSGETVLQDVRVIAVDQQIAQGPGGAEAAVGRVARTVTLEVTPDQAERVVVAIALGRLALAVRAMAPTEDVEGERAPTTFAGDVSPALQRSAVSPGQRMRVIQGGAESNVTFR
ncbi:MAG TPA: Flp pilus assembly protein CpaB [Acetobacteraceae bacterium]|nr:Flp pilus assembly protein CpaB [Acetobacteraceae bacterium]